MLAWLLHNSLLALLLLTFGGMLLFMLMESFTDSEGLGNTPRLVANWGLALINFFVGLFFTGLLLLPLLHSISTPVQLSSLHPLIEFALVVLVFEAISYALHRSFHRIPFLWPLHAVHHLDTRLDVTTSHRHHVAEALINTLLLVPAAVLLGVSAEVWLVFILLRTLVALWSHSQLYLPGRLDKMLRWVIVTPAFHRNHHLSELSYTNSNYGILVPWYDYLFGTASVPQSDGLIGLEYLRNADSVRLDHLLLLPLRWRQLRKVGVNERQHKVPEQGTTTH